MLQGDNLKNKHARVIVLVHDTSSECALQMYEVSLKYLQGLSSYRVDTILTDRQADARGKQYEKYTFTRFPLQVLFRSFLYLKINRTSIISYVFE